jgi:predicted nucleic acid-binding Zn ribbon protein
MAKKICSHCGASIDTSRKICPKCRVVMNEKSSLKPYLIIGGIIVIVILIAGVLLLSLSPQSVSMPVPAITVPPTAMAVQAPIAPSCTIGITGQKVPPSSIQLRVMAGTCSAGEVTELKVSVNGVQQGTLGTSPGASGTFAGTSGTNNVIVVAKFANGAENVVYQNVAL